MRKIIIPAIPMAVLLLVNSCSKQEVTNKTDNISVCFVAQQITDSELTKSAYIDGRFQWSDKDTVGIYPDSGSQIYFSMAEGAGTSSATFDGGGWGFRSKAVYYSYYPFIADFYLDRHRIPVSLTGQVQNGASNLDHFGKYDYMYTPAAAENSGAIVFSYKHLVCIIRVTATLPAGSYRQITITAPTAAFVQKGYFDLQSESQSIIPTSSSKELTVAFKDPITVNGSQQFMAYLISNPVNFKDTEIKVSAVDINKKQYDCKKTPSKNYEPATINGLSCTSWTEVPQTVGLAIDDWGDGGNISGEAE